MANFSRNISHVWRDIMAKKAAPKKAEKKAPAKPAKGEKELPAFLQKNMKGKKGSKGC